MVISSAERNRIRTRAQGRALAVLRDRYRPEYDTEYQAQLTRAQAESSAIQGPEADPILDTPVGLGRRLAAG